jgi:hypothetical protein
VNEGWRYVYDVESADEEHGQVSVSLVRKREHHVTQHLRSRTETLDRTVLFSRRFLPIRDSIALERYSARLSQIARHAQDGTFGCFAETRSDGPSVEVRSMPLTSSR